MCLTGAAVFTSCQVGATRNPRAQQARNASQSRERPVRGCDWCFQRNERRGRLGYGSSPSSDTCQSFDTAATQNPPREISRPPLPNGVLRENGDRRVEDRRRRGHGLQVPRHLLRTDADRLHWAAVHDLDYDNSKNRVALTRGWAWHDTILEIWCLTRDLPDRVADRALRANRPGTPSSVCGVRWDPKWPSERGGKGTGRRSPRAFPCPRDSA